MSHLTFKEHLFLYEERRKDLKYTEKQVKGVLDRVSVALAGTDAANMTKMAKRYARLEVSLKALKEKHDELNGKLKDEVSGLFNAEDILLTRVAETAQFTLTLAKQIKKGPTDEVDYKSIIAALTALISDELQPKVDMIIEKYTTSVAAREPAARLSVSKEVVKEGFFDFTTKLKKMAETLYNSLVSWASRYDSKLDRLKEKSGVA